MTNIIFLIELVQPNGTTFNLFGPKDHSELFELDMLLVQFEHFFI